MDERKKVWLILDRRNKSLIKKRYQNVGYELTAEPNDAMSFDRIGDAMNYVASMNHYQPTNYQVVPYHTCVDETADGTRNNKNVTIQ